MFAGGDITRSENDYDWLGSGAYFWENNYVRAMEWAQSMVGKPRKTGSPITEPAVIGAVIDLGNCLNFLDQTAMALARNRFKKIAAECDVTGIPLPKNTNPTFMAGSEDRIYRRLDRAVIKEIHLFVKENNLPEFDAVRAVFLEGEALYEHSGFLEKTHIQICVRNPKNILGFFRPRVG